MPLGPTTLPWVNSGSLKRDYNGQTCQQKQDLFNSAGTPGSYGSSSCSDAQQAYGSTCCEATCEMCPAGKSMRNSSEIAGHYSDGTLYTCGAARERLHSFAAASAECDLAVSAGQYRYLAAAACCFAPPPPPFPPGSKPPSPPPAVAAPTCDLCGGVPDVTHPTGRKVVTGILQPMCWAGSFETNGTSQLTHSDGTRAFEQDGLEWGTILGVDGAGAPHGAVTGSGGQQVTCGWVQDHLTTAVAQMSSVQAGFACTKARSSFTQNCCGHSCAPSPPVPS